MNKYLEEIFIHLDGVAMAPIYELITDDKKSQIKRNDLINPSSLTVSTAYSKILCAVLQGQRIIERHNDSFKWTKYGKSIDSSGYIFSGVRDYYASSILLIKDSNTRCTEEKKVLEKFTPQKSKETETINGSPDEIVERLVDVIKNKLRLVQ